jgi:general secretion pathway protein G
MPEFRLQRSPRRHVRGLTVIELLFAVLILGVLGGIAQSKYADYREKIRRQQAIQDITTLQVVIAQYELEEHKVPGSLADVSRAGMLDPWGRPYVYTDIGAPGGHGKARKDHKLNLINTSYDLYSVGPDGVSKTQLTNKDSLDDIVRARDGAFIGVAADFTQ